MDRSLRTADAGILAHMEGIPAPSFQHLHRMTDHVGVWEHARFTTPRPEHGYCTDDNARSLILISRQPDPSADLVGLARVYFRFVADAALPEGGFHNRRGADESWGDEIGSDDSQGRAIWSLGTAARLGPEEWMRNRALELFDRQQGFASRSPRANAFAILGASEVLTGDPGHVPARKAMTQWAGQLHVLDDPEWPWPEPRLAYDNARIPEALIAAGSILGHYNLLEAGLHLLDWLMAIETWDSHYSFTPVGGWARGEARPGYDQQPVETAAMADACSRAWLLTGDEKWRDGVVRAARWLVGDNDGEVILYDFETGGCCDGLTPSGPNLNQGAESTISALSALQQARIVAQPLNRSVGQLSSTEYDSPDRS
jgi:hypothetical protein